MTTAPLPFPTSYSPGAYPSHPLLEVLEKGPKKAPEDHQALLDVLDPYGGVAMLDDVIK